MFNRISRIGGARSFHASISAQYKKTIEQLAKEKPNLLKGSNVLVVIILN